ncbi:putative leucine-rich repeat receptor-like protein kinase At2g19210 isoform X2 [Oryza brachyantha]|uniref:putative leucine-rich repeat receptor-like protein kinase At2g19210 isoform X2 n=1 Tax=Oryza brachyantha TaxID=4533 RepID=UPI0003EA95C7|nr:putative leucine-rich repeat receptor-like protein kinase At2g19210 isoform X2 [Oryza brachyantha]
MSLWEAVFVVTLSLLFCIHGQLDNLGFISIDCGYITTPSYQDSKRNLTYVADVGFTDAGFIHNVDVGSMQMDLSQQYTTVRNFPNGTRNCYTLKQLTRGGKYLVRATFGYGNYDALNMTPAFDLYLGANYWVSVNITDASRAYIYESIVMSPDELLQVCLVNIGSGTPFISGLDLRSLPANFYPEAHVLQTLVLLSFFREGVSFGLNRFHFGTDNHNIRYPVDHYDRFWQRYEDIPGWEDVPDKMNGTVKTPQNNTYGAPSDLMRSASTVVNASWMDLRWSSDASMDVGISPEYFVVLYFAELQAIPDNASRQFLVSVDNTLLAAGFSPRYMMADVLSQTVKGSGPHSILLNATITSKLPPMVSGMEIFLVRTLKESPTDSSDANAVMTIQTKYSVKKNWEGDPCSPAAFSWDGLSCNYTPIGDIQYNPTGLHRITALNLSFSELIGDIDASFGQLSSLQHLIGNNPNLCGDHTCNPNSISNENKKRDKVVSRVIAAVIVAMVLALSLSAVFIWYRRRKTDPDVLPQADPYKSRRFKYKELQDITNDWKNVIGEGGFGHVYAGKLEDGTAVAVKVESQTLRGNRKQFLAEVQHLTRVHHKNLVSLIGYCDDKEHRCLVYEYMDGGTLEARLRGQEAPSEPPLTWLQRLNIALGSANGLNYLHRSCSQPLIHRDVKTGNILLTASLEVKISDFGLTRASIHGTVGTHTPTQLAGTPGYMDPESLQTSHPSESNDVFSFGVVLMVIITGRSAIVTINGVERNLAQCMRDWLLNGGGIEAITDPRIRDNCNHSSVEMVAQLALDCTQPTGQDRPIMEDVVTTLTQSLQLELSLSSPSFMRSRTTISSAVRFTGSGCADRDAAADYIAALQLEQAFVETSTRYVTCE